MAGPNAFSVAADILEKGSRLTAPEFAERRLGQWMYSKQREICESVRLHRRTAVQSCHGAGKTFTAADLAAWWIDSHPIGQAFVFSTAPSDDQVKGVLWREIGRMHRKARLPGHVNLKEWYIDGELVAMGRKPRDEDPTAMQGIHARYVLCILDEACGIPKDLWMAANSLADNDTSRILAIGNPDDPGSYFHEVCKPGTTWNVIKISYLDTPHFSGEVIPDEYRDLLREGIIGPTYVEEMRHDVGESGAPFISKCLGEWPVDAEDGVVSLTALRFCQREDQDDLAPDDLLPHQLGWDVGAGGDRSVLRERRGKCPGRVWYPKGSDTMKQVGEVVNVLRDNPTITAIKIDAIGVGWGAADRLQELYNAGVHQAKVVKVVVSEASTKPAKYYRLRDEIWWVVGHEMIRDGAFDLRGLDEATVSQLLAPKYALDSGGRIKVEPKDETRSRLGRSPDDADALLLAYYSGQTQGQAFLEMWKRQTQRAKNQQSANPPLTPAGPARASGRSPLRRGWQGGAPAVRRVIACEHLFGQDDICRLCGEPRVKEVELGGQEE